MSAHTQGLPSSKKFLPLLPLIIIIIIIYQRIKQLGKGTDEFFIRIK